MTEQPAKAPASPNDRHAAAHNPPATPLRVSPAAEETVTPLPSPAQGQPKPQQAGYQPQFPPAPGKTQPNPSSPIRTAGSGSPTNPSVQQQPAAQGEAGAPPASHASPYPLVPVLSTGSQATHNTGASSSQQSQSESQSQSHPPDASVALGVEALERQQAQLEQRRAMAQQAMAAKQHHPPQHPSHRRHGQAPSYTHHRQQHNHHHARHHHHQQMAQVPGGGYYHPQYPSGGHGHAGGGGVGLSHSDDDNNTEPSSDMPSSAAGAEDGTGGRGSGPLPRRTGSFASMAKFIKTPLKMTRGTTGGGDKNTPLNTTVQSDMVSPNPAEGASIVNQDDAIWASHKAKPLVYGYLHKIARNGVWQRRFFETDGERLTYYKSRKRIKLLASLDLLKVGEIKCDDADPDGCVFCIQVSDRPYYLRAENKQSCNDWVISLNRVREARMQIGGFQLVQPHFSSDEAEGSGGSGSVGSGGDRNRSESDEYAARVVMIANRSRTRAIATTETEDSLKKMLRTDSHPQATSMDLPATVPESPSSSLPQTTEGMLMSPPTRIGAALEGWDKRQSNLQRLKLKLTLWARKINLMKCMKPPFSVHNQYTPNAHSGFDDQHHGVVGQHLSDVDEIVKHKGVGSQIMADSDVRELS